MRRPLARRRRVRMLAINDQPNRLLVAAFHETVDETVPSGIVGLPPLRAITKPARADNMVKWIFGVKSPRNCPYTSAVITTDMMTITTATLLYGGVRGSTTFAGDVMAATP